VPRLESWGGKTENDLPGEHPVFRGENLVPRLGSWGKNENDLLGEHD